MLTLRNRLLAADYATDPSRWKTLSTAVATSATFADAAVAAAGLANTFTAFDNTAAAQNLDDAGVRNVLTRLGKAATELDASMSLLEKYVAYLTDQTVGGSPVSRQDFEKARALISELTEVEKFADDDGEQADGFDVNLALGPAGNLERGYKSYQAWKAESTREFAQGPRGSRRLGHFRLKLATSSQMINYSGLRFDRSGEQVVGNEQQSRDEFIRVPNQSRICLLYTSPSPRDRG